MFDINDELNTIIKKYGLFERVLFKDRIESAIREIICEYTEKYGKRIIVRGQKCNEGEYPLLKVISDYGEIIAVVDRAPFSDKIWLNQQVSVPMMNLDEAENAECDVYIITSLYQGKNIYYDVTTSGKESGVIDLYKELRIRYGIAIEQTFDQYTDEEDLSHNKTQEAYTLFCAERTREHLLKLLSACLSNRDFVTFFEVMDETQDLIDESDRLNGLKEDIINLLDKVHTHIKMRESNASKDIVMHWIDQAGFEELDNFPLLQSMMDQGLMFEKAYTITPYTSATETCLFYGDEVCALNRSNPKEIILRRGLRESRLYQNILNKGYEFSMMGHMVEKCLPEERGEYTQFMVASCVLYWNMLNLIINSDKPVFGMVGCLAETHEPWMSPKCDAYNPSFEFNGDYRMSESKIKQSAGYFDKVINFFTDMLGKETIHIYMSDHGKWEDVGLRRYSDFAMHAILGITNIGITGRVTKIFSYKYFAQLIDYVIRSADRGTGELIFGDMEIRSAGFRAVIKSSIQETFESEEDRERIYSEVCSGYIGIKTEEDTYIRLNCGREIYFLNTDRDNNRIDDPKYGERIQALYERLKQQNEC